MSKNYSESPIIDPPPKKTPKNKGAKRGRKPTTTTKKRRKVSAENDSKIKRRKYEIRDSSSDEEDNKSGILPSSKSATVQLVVKCEPSDLVDTPHNPAAVTEDGLDTKGESPDEGGMCIKMRIKEEQQAVEDEANEPLDLEVILYTEKYAIILFKKTYAF